MRVEVLGVKRRSAKEPCCFISYSYDSERHIDWARRLAEDLTSKGIYVYLDQRDEKLWQQWTDWCAEYEKRQQEGLN